MLAVNIDWALGILDDFIRAWEGLGAGDRNGHDYRDELRRLIYPVNKIYEQLNAPPIDAQLDLYDPEDSFGSPLMTAKQAIGVLHHLEDVAINLAPSAPSLSADQFHQWVWRAASTFWATGHFPSAVETAAKSLTAHIQEKSGSKLADRELARDVFSPKPSKDGRARLWLPGERDTDTWASRQDGLHYMAMGAYAGLRNVAAHELNTGWSEREALEHLAVLSTVARWAAETDVVYPVP